MKTEKQDGAVPVTHKLKVRTSRRTELKDLTAEIAEVVKESGCENGMCYLNVPHTTAGGTINEGNDPAMAHYIEPAFDRLVPTVRNSAHAEGNSDSHIKTAMVGTSAPGWMVGGKLGG